MSSKAVGGGTPLALGDHVSRRQPPGGTLLRQPSRISFLEIESPEVEEKEEKDEEEGKGRKEER